MTGIDKDLKVRRLIAALFPTRKEKFYEWAKMKCWAISETGITGWIGDRLDDAWVHSVRRRANKGKHEVAMPSKKSQK